MGVGDILKLTRYNKNAKLLLISVFTVTLLLGNASLVFAQNFNPAITITEPTVEGNVRFGGVFATGDINGDGKLDVVVGTSRSTPGSCTGISCGEIHVFLGPNYSTGTTINSPVIQVLGLYGGSVAIGDLNGDIYDDVIVSE